MVGQGQGWQRGCWAILGEVWREARGTEQEGDREDGQVGPREDYPRVEERLSLWSVVILRGHAGHSTTSMLDMPMPLARIWGLQASE